MRLLASLNKKKRLDAFVLTDGNWNVSGTSEDVRRRMKITIKRRPSPPLGAALLADNMSVWEILGELRLIVASAPEARASRDFII